MFRLNRNERSHWSGNGVHVEPELVFMIGRNMHEQANLLVVELNDLFSMGFLEVQHAVVLGE